jgi:hypothetical protein
MSLLLPEGTRLLHIGPAKTGTTSLQSAFHHNREALAAHGVHYAGGGTQPRAAAGAAALGRRIPGHRHGLSAWPRLVAEVDSSTAARVVISSETFARADDAHAAGIVEAFGADRTHVVITMRPLADMLPSSWQQEVQTGSRTTYPAWLDEMLRREATDDAPPPPFWRKSRIDVLARRWAALVGADRVTVVSLAAAPREFVLRTFEELTGLPTGTLEPGPGSDNASLSHAVTEVVRRFNVSFGGLEGASADVQARLIEFGAARHLRGRPDLVRADDRIELPAWAAERAAEVMREMTAGIRAAGVRTLGDLDALAVTSRPPVETIATPELVSIDAAAELLVGMMLAAGRGVPTFDHLRGKRPPLDLSRVPTRRLVRTTAERVRHGVRGRLRRGDDLSAS